MKVIALIEIKTNAVELIPSQQRERSFEVFNFDNATQEINMQLTENESLIQIKTYNLNG